MTNGTRRLPRIALPIVAVGLMLGGCASTNVTQGELGTLNNRARSLANVRDANSTGNPDLVDEYRAFALRNRLSSQTYIIRDEGDGDVTFAPGDDQFISFRPLLRKKKPGPVGSLYSESAAESCVISRRAGNVWELFCVGLPEAKKAK